MKTAYKSEKVGIIFGLFFILIGTLCNTAVLTFLFAPDGTINTFGYRVIIWSFDISCVLVGFLFIKHGKAMFKFIYRFGFIIMIIWLFSFFSFAEITLRKKGYKPWRIHESNIIVEPGSKFFTKNPTLGYTLLPGKFKVTLNNTSYSFNVTHLSNALRITHSLNTYNFEYSKREIWIFGCSYTYGWSVNDEETYPWLVQEKFPEYEIVNFGVPGYGTIHSLIQLREALEERDMPQVAILAHMSCHDERNIFARSRQKGVAPWNKLGPLTQPYAKIDSSGVLHYHMAKVVYRKFPLMQYSAFVHWLEMQYNKIEAYFHRPRNVTKALIKEFSRLCSENDIKFIVVTLDSPDHDMLEYCEKEEILVVDISPEWNKETTNYPYDGHPGPRGCKILAQKLCALLNTILKSSR